MEEKPVLSICHLEIPMSLLFTGMVLRWFGNEHGVSASKTFFVGATLTFIAVVGYGVYKYRKDEKELESIVPKQ